MDEAEAIRIANKVRAIKILRASSGIGDGELLLGLYEAKRIIENLLVKDWILVPRELFENDLNKY